MQRRIIWILAAVAVVVSVLLWLLTSSTPRRSQLDSQPTDAPSTPTPAPEQRIMLLFAGQDGLLHPELRSAPLPDEIHERIQVVMHELLAGPSDTSTLLSVFPYDAALRSVFVDDNGNAFVDLTAPPTELEGSNIEILLAYGVVDTIILNCPDVTAVQLLFGGNEIDTLTGHLDLSKPMVLNKRFIASS